jgi:hypothetical protein
MTSSPQQVAYAGVNRPDILQRQGMPLVTLTEYPDLPAASHKTHSRQVQPAARPFDTAGARGVGDCRISRASRRRPRRRGQGAALPILSALSRAAARGEQSATVPFPAGPLAAMMVNTAFERPSQRQSITVHFSPTPSIIDANGFALHHGPRGAYAARSAGPALASRARAAAAADRNRCRRQVCALVNGGGYAEYCTAPQARPPAPRESACCVVAAARRAAAARARRRAATEATRTGDRRRRRRAGATERAGPRRPQRRTGAGRKWRPRRARAARAERG